MAYQKKFTKWEKEFPDAYFQINTIIWKNIDDEVYTEIDDKTVLTWEKQEICEALVGIYQDANSRFNRVAALDILRIQFKYDINSNRNLIQQAYDKLKTIPEFKDGIDI